MPNDPTKQQLEEALASLVRAADRLLDVYCSDYDVQEVGGDPLEKTMEELSDALTAATSTCFRREGRQQDQQQKQVKGASR